MSGAVHRRRARHPAGRGASAGPEPEGNAVFNILGLIVVGLIIGALARLIVPGKQRLSILATLLLGVVGALIGGLIASALGTGDIFELNVLGFVIAVIAAVLLVGVAEGISGKNRRAVR
jgi:uncharacterized membrane protein YeaQ/YmgE (transglycosylase-associated protein family)